MNLALRIVFGILGLWCIGVGLMVAWTLLRRLV